MAKQIITKLIDDIDGGTADETLSFALDGIGYEIDLGARNAKKVRDFLATFIEAGTRTGRVGQPAQIQRHRPTTTTASGGSAHPNFMANRRLNAEIREWAEKNGYSLAERGRIPQHIVDAYHLGQPNQAALDALAAEAAEAAAAHKPSGGARRLRKPPVAAFRAQSA